MKKTLVTAAVLSAVAYIALPAQAADPLKTEVAAGEAYKVTAPAEKDGKLQKGQIAYKATNKTTVETVKGGAGSTLTFEKGNWQRVFNAEGVKGWDVSSFDKIDINVTNRLFVHSCG